ncbi:hypothetical protein J6590_029506 [Homalodisca vitripennis]|nr:hypothetical protein J6590_029506 [Homalodisca vitripennis]
MTSLVQVVAGDEQNTWLLWSRLIGSHYSVLLRHLAPGSPARYERHSALSQWHKNKQAILRVRPSGHPQQNLLRPNSGNNWARFIITGISTAINNGVVVHQALLG